MTKKATAGRRGTGGSQAFRAHLAMIRERLERGDLAKAIYDENRDKFPFVYSNFTRYVRRYFPDLVAPPPGAGGARPSPAAVAPAPPPTPAPPRWGGAPCAPPHRVCSRACIAGPEARGRAHRGRRCPRQNLHP